MSTATLTNPAALTSTDALNILGLKTYVRLSTQLLSSVRGCDENYVISEKSNQFFSQTPTLTPSSDTIGANIKENESKLAIARAFGLVSIGLFVLFIILAIANVIHFALWLPALVGLVGVMVATGAQINRLDVSLSTRG